MEKEVLLGGRPVVYPAVVQMVQTIDYFPQLF